MEKINRNKKILLIIIATVLLLAAIAVGLAFVITYYTQDREEPTPWYRDYENIEYILEDERSAEKSFSYSGIGNQPRIEFNYVYDKDNPKECIPNFTIKYKGEVQETYTFVYLREAFPRKIDGVDYSDGRIVAGIRKEGWYRVELYIYLTEADMENMNNDIYRIYIFINIE
jgi:hypothetical protein